METVYKSISANKLYSSFPSVCGIYFTNNGLHPDYECNLINNLLITPERVERNYLYFKDLISFIKWIKSITIDIEEDSDVCSSSSFDVGYYNYYYKTEYGVLEISHGLFMDNHVSFRRGNTLTFLGNPVNWLNS